MRKQQMAAMVLAGAMAVSLPCHASGAPQTGHYATQPGWGELVISFDGANRRFVLDSVADNGHACTLSGVVQTGSNVLSTTGSGPVCRLRLHAEGSGWLTEVLDAPACQRHCGSRSRLAGLFVPLPEACRWRAREQARAAFRQQYDRRAFEQALGVLDQLQTRCGGFIDWLEADALANDRAITEFRLGRPGQCLRTLAGTRAAGVVDIERLDTELQLGRLQHQAYLPVARATLYNRNKCRQALEQDQDRLGSAGGRLYQEG